MSRPVILGAALGWRGWRVSEDLDGSPLLLSAGRATWWEEATHQAVCGEGAGSHPREPAPHPDCACGVYALSQASVGELVFWGGEVFGVVAGRGAMCLHARGWRAEEAQLLALFVISPDEIEAHRAEITARALSSYSPASEATLKALGERYGVQAFASLAEASEWCDRLREREPDLAPPAPELCPEDELGPTDRACEQLVAREMRSLALELSQLQRQFQCVGMITVICALVGLAFLVAGS